MKTNGILKSAMIWFGSVMGVILATVMLPILGTKAEQLETLSSGSGDLVYQSGSLSVIHRSAPDYIDTEGNVFEMGSFVIKSGDTVILEVMDRNLGATTSDVNGTGSYGYKFQQGNNYGFNGLYLEDSNKTTDLVVSDRKTLNWVNRSSYYAGNKFVYGMNVLNNSGSMDWVSESGGVYSDSDYLWGMNAQDGTSNYLRQGPCPEGYYVPSNSDFVKLRNLLLDYQSDLLNILNISYAGYYHNANAKLYDTGSSAIFRSSTAEKMLKVTLSGSVSMTYHPRSQGYSVRCFGDISNDNTITLTIDTQGGQLIPSQTLLKNNSPRKFGYTPKRFGYVFNGWYLTGGQEYRLGYNGGFSGDTTLYAKWLNVEGGELIYQSGSLNVIKVDDAPSYIDTEGNEFEMSSLVIYDSVNGEKPVKLLDRNLGATTSDVNDTGSYGYKFQWGNNYGFPGNEDLTGDILVTGFVDVTNYSWQNPYVSDKFVYQHVLDESGYVNHMIRRLNSGDWATPTKHNELWGFPPYFEDWSYSDYMTQGPCPEGYHIPEEYAFWDYSDDWQGVLRNYLPYPGYLSYYEGMLLSSGSGGYYWGAPNLVSNCFGAEAFSVHPGGKGYIYWYEGCGNDIISEKANGLPVRCFANDDLDTTVLLTFDSMGGQKMPGQMVPVGGTGHTQGYEPKRQGYSFEGWYKDELYTQPYSFENDIITENTVVYAKWEGGRVTYTFMDEDVEIMSGVTYIGDKLVRPISPSKSGYIFAGWYVDLELTIKYNFDTELTGDVVLYAKYAEDMDDAIESLKQDNSDPFVIEGTTIENTGDDSLYQQVDTGDIATGIDMMETQTDDLVTKVSLIYQDKTDEITIGEESTGTQINGAEFISESNSSLNIEGGVDIFVQQSIYSGEDVLKVKQTKNNTVNFSRPVAIPIPVNLGTEFAKIRVRHAGDESYGLTGLTLNPESKCLSGSVLSGDDQYDGSDVRADSGRVWIFTCSASTFVAYTEEKIENTPVSSNGGHSRRNNVDQTEVEEVKVTISDHAKSTYNQEQLDAYKWAYSKGITTIDDADEARLSDPLTRAELAKMMSQYILAVLDRQPENTGEVSYPDVDDSMGDLASFVKVAYRYGIMGINPDGTPLDIFRPYEVVTRAHLATVFSRVLFGNRFDKLDGNYYEDHINNLNKAGILNNTNPKMQEIRGWVMLMMYRSAK